MYLFVSPIAPCHRHPKTGSFTMTSATVWTVLTVNQTEDKITNEKQW